MENKSIFDEMKEAGSSIPDKVEYLLANGWKPHNHHDNWIKEFDLNSAYEKCKKDQAEISNAVNVLCKALREDSALYIAYQANIAMAFKDEWDRRAGEIGRADNVLEIANTAAKNFLDLLIRP